MSKTLASCIGIVLGNLLVWCTVVAVGTYLYGRYSLLEVAGVFVVAGIIVFSARLHREYLGEKK